MLINQAARTASHSAQRCRAGLFAIPEPAETSRRHHLQRAVHESRLFAKLPVSINSTTSDQQMIDSVRQPWQDSLSAFRHSLTLGAGGQQVLAVVRRIEDEQLRARKRANSRCKTYREEWGDRGGMIFTGHHKVSGLMRGRRSAAQASVNQRGLAGRSSARDEDIAALLDCEPQDFARSGSMTPEAT